MGIRSLQHVFDAFSLKLWWNFRLRQSLWAEFRHLKYCLEVYPYFSDFSPGHSHTWKRMVHVQVVAEKHICWSLDSGSSSFWHDNWLGMEPLYKQVESFQEHSVADFVMEGRWDLQSLNRVLPPGWVQQVLGVAPPTAAKADEMIWAPTNSGEFTISSAYQIMRNECNASSLFPYQALSSKISFFMLRLMYGRLSLMDVLHKFGFLDPSKCFYCSLRPSPKTISHIFFTGEVAK